MQRFSRLVILSTAIMAVPARPSAAEVLDNLLRRVPASANAVAVIKVQELLKSQRAVKENWAAKRQLDYMEGAVPFPPSLEVVVLAAQFGADRMGHNWEIGLFPFDKAIQSKDIAEREKGAVETVAGQYVVNSPRGAYFLELVPGVVGTMTPPNRQELARWIRFARVNREPALSPFLQEAVRNSGKSQIVMAFDMEDIVNPGAIKIGLANSATLKGKPKEAEALAGLLSSLKGATFSVRVTDEIQGELRLDFGRDVGPETDHIKGLILEALDDLGAELEDFKECEHCRLEKAITLQANMTAKGVRRVLSLIQTPAPSRAPERSRPGLRDTDVAVTKARPVEQDLELAASLRYYRTIGSLLDELKKRNKKARDYVKTALWHDKFARQIEQLPTDRVDKDLLKYGASTSAKIRMLGDNLRGAPIEVARLQSYVSGTAVASGGLSVGLGGIGYQPGSMWVDTNLGKIRDKQTEFLMKSEDDRRRVWKLIDEDRAHVRKHLYDRFHTDFDAPQPARIVPN